MSQKISDEDLMDFADGRRELLNEEKLQEIRDECKRNPKLYERVSDFRASYILVNQVYRHWDYYQDKFHNETFDNEEKE